MSPQRDLPSVIVHEQFEALRRARGVTCRRARGVGAPAPLTGRDVDAPALTGRPTYHCAVRTIAHFAYEP